VKTQLLINF